MHPQINPAYLDAQLLERAIDKTAKIVQDMHTVVTLIETQGNGFTDEQRDAALDCLMMAHDAFDKLVALRLAVI